MATQVVFPTSFHSGRFEKRKQKTIISSCFDSMLCRHYGRCFGCLSEIVVVVLIVQSVSQEGHSFGKLENNNINEPITSIDNESWHFVDP